MASITSRFARKEKTGPERRRSERLPHVAEAWIASPTDFDKEHRLEVTSVNLSRHGLAFSLDRPVSPGSFWVMELGLGPQRMASEIRIATCRETENGQHEIGAEFC